MSSTLCWQQEREQLSRAADATLENVRAIALRAAKAWHAEALLAEKTEARKAAFLEARLAGLISDDDDGDEDTLPVEDDWPSENPDRGLSQDQGVGTT